MTTVVYRDHTGAALAPDVVAQKLAALAYCHTDADGVFMEINDAYCDLYGYSREELIGKHFTMVLPEAAREAVAALHTAFINGDTEMPQEWTVMNKAGELMKIRTEALRMETKDERPSKLTIIEKVD